MNIFYLDKKEYIKDQNVEEKYIGDVASSAAAMLGHAITAKTAKMDKKLKMIQLQLQKAKLDQQIKKDAGKEKDDEEPIDGKGMVLDRNELLKHILNKEGK